MIQTDVFKYKALLFINKSNEIIWHFDRDDLPIPTCDFGRVFHDFMISNPPLWTPYWTLALTHIDPWASAGIWAALYTEFKQQSFDSNTDQTYKPKRPQNAHFGGHLRSWHEAIFVENLPNKHSKHFLLRPLTLWRSGSYSFTVGAKNKYRQCDLQTSL